MAAACFYQLRRIRQIRRIINQEVAAQMVHALVISKLDYCNGVLAGLPAVTIAPLQRVQNAAARLVLNLKLSDHVTSALKQLHWLPVRWRIQYKLCLLMFHIHIGQSPQYMTELVSACAANPSRPGMRSGNSARYIVPRCSKFGERAFSFSGLNA